MPKSRPRKRNAAPPKVWRVQVYRSDVSAGWYAHLFDPSGVCRSWRDCFSRNGALLSLLTFAEERLAATERADAMTVIRQAIETGKGAKG